MVRRNEFKVSIIVPVYNRHHLITDAVESVLDQSYQNWELLLIDDGSTDDTAVVCKEFAKCHERIHYFYQENKGPYAARNKGLDAATGDYIAFLDSDDMWCRHHLSSSVEFLEKYQNIDIVFGALKRIDLGTGKTIVAHGYHPDGSTPHPFITLKYQTVGKGKLITDERIKEYIIRYGTPGALHCMVYRRKVFSRLRFNPGYRTVWDRIALMQMVFQDRRFAYFDDIHLIYRVHTENISTVKAHGNQKKLEKSAKVLIQAYKEFLIEISNPHSMYVPVVKKKIAEFYAWYLGSVLVDQNRFKEAVRCFEKAVLYDPLNPLYYKSYLSTIVKRVICGSGN